MIPQMLAVEAKTLKIGASLYSGITALESANTQASLLEEQGLLTKDDYFRQAALVKEEGHRIRAKQTMEYISSGVEIAGTPQLMLRETLSKSLAKAGSLETTGLNYEKLYNRKARIVKKEGQAALTQSILSAGAELIGG